MTESIRNCVRYFESRVGNEIRKAHLAPDENAIVMTDYAEKLVHKHDRKVDAIMLKMKKGNKNAPLVLTDYANQLLLNKTKKS
jgi:hypothetical protein